MRQSTPRSWQNSAESATGRNAFEPELLYPSVRQRFTPPGIGSTFAIASQAFSGQFRARLRDEGANSTFFLVHIAQIARWRLQLGCRPSEYVYLLPGLRA